MASARRIPVYAFHPGPAGALPDEGSAAGEVAMAFYLPLGMGMVMERARQGDAAGEWDFEVPISFSLAELLDAVRAHGRGVCLFSNYVWSLAANLEASAAVKALEPGCWTVHGGPSTPKYAGASEAFLRQHAHVDVAVRGEGEDTTASLLRAVAAPLGAGSAAGARAALGAVDGLAFLDSSGAHVQTPDRPVIRDLDSLPSPYLTGAFDRALERRSVTPDDVGDPPHARLTHATLETNRGCPYGCTFCDWGSATLQKIRTFDLERVRAELEWMGRHGVQDIFIADANVGILPRDVEVAEMIADVRRRHGSPRSLALNYTKNGSRHLRRILEIWKAADIQFQGGVSIQSTDPATLTAIRRTNIKTKAYRELSDIYRALDVPVRRQLMSGLPGQTVAAWKQDLQICFDASEFAQLFATRLLPNSPMASPEDVARYRIRADADGVILETASFTEEDWRTMQRIGVAFLLHHNRGVLRHYLRFLQLDHGVRAIDFIHAHLEAVRAAPARWPESAALLDPVLDTPTHRAPTAQHLGAFYDRGWEPLLGEVARFAEERFGVPLDSAGETALRAQGAILPRRGGAPALTAPLAHDFVDYTREAISALRAGGRTVAPLRARPPGVLYIDASRDGRREDGPLPDLWAFDADFLARSSLDAEVGPPAPRPPASAMPPPERPLVGRWPEAIRPTLRGLADVAAEVDAAGGSVIVWVGDDAGPARAGVVLAPLVRAEPHKIWKRTATTAFSYRGELSRVAAVAEALLAAVRGWEARGHDRVEAWWSEEVPTLAGCRLEHGGE